jgi:hypothetical protein
LQASSAEVYTQITSQYAPADDLPCADFTLLVPRTLFLCEKWATGGEIEHMRMQQSRKNTTFSPSILPHL